MVDQSSKINSQSYLGDESMTPINDNKRQLDDSNLSRPSKFGIQDQKAKKSSRKQQDQKQKGSALGTVVNSVYNSVASSMETKNKKSKLAGKKKKHGKTSTHQKESKLSGVMSNRNNMLIEGNDDGFDQQNILSGGEADDQAYEIHNLSDPENGGSPVPHLNLISPTLDHLPDIQKKTSGSLQFLQNVAQMENLELHQPFSDEEELKEAHHDQIESNQYALNPFLADQQLVSSTPTGMLKKQKTNADVKGSRSSTMGFNRLGSDSKNQSEGNFLGKYSAVIGSEALGHARALIAEEDIGGLGTSHNGVDDFHNKSNLSGINLLHNMGDQDQQNQSQDLKQVFTPADLSKIKSNPQYLEQYLVKYQQNQDKVKDDVNIFGVELVDPDKKINQVEEELKEHSKKRLQRDLGGIHDKLERMDTAYTELEDIFSDQIRQKEMDIEHLDPQEMLQKESIIEFNELKRLEKQLRRVEKEKIGLLKGENRSENDLLLESGQRGLTLEELEAHYEIKAQERERALTRLFGRLNSKIKAQILSNEGTSKFQVRKIPQHKKDLDKERRLFEGIRDQRIGAKWLKTPQPVEIKCMIVRGLKDKVPKGNYVIRCGVLDRMIENKIYYKFLEYGNRVKAEEEARQDREAEQKKKELELQQQQEKEPNKLFQSSSNYESLGKAGEKSRSQIQDDSRNQHRDGDDGDDEEKRLIIFHHDSDEDGEPKVEVGGDEIPHENHRHNHHHNQNAHVQFGQGTHFEHNDNKQNEESNFQKQIRGQLRINGPNKNPIQQQAPEDQRKADFEKMARYSLYKPQGGQLTRQQSNQDLEKVWIDFGKQHTKLVEFEASHESEEMKFEGHKIYFVVPPNMNLQPSNVLIFELIWLSSQTQHDDYVAAWGAYPLVNGDFEINEGKFKVPLLNGSIDFSSNKFKDIEKKYIRNVDEWLANLYIEVKKFDLVDFQMYNQKIEFKVPVEKKKELTAQGVKSKDGKDDKSEESDESDFDAEEEPYYGGDGGDRIDYHRYKYKVNQSSYDLRSQYETQDLTMRKIQYVTGELLSDLGLGKLNFYNTVETTFIAFIVIWLRMAFHYLGQYLILKAMNCPVISVDLNWYKIKINYAYWNVGQEVAVVTVGVVSNTILLALFILICYLSQRFIFCFPRSFCRLIAWFAIATIFDFFLISVIDFAVQDWEGDIFKLYNYYNQSNSSGFVGYFLTFIIQLGLLIINLFIFYNYIVFVHLDGRLADIWSRISGKVKNFFIPQDNEVSFNYLRNLYQIGEINNNRIIVNMISTYDSQRPGVQETAKLIHFYKFGNQIKIILRQHQVIESEVSLEQGRVFLANQKGQIQELNLNEMGQQNDESNIEYYLKNVKQFLRPDQRTPLLSEDDEEKENTAMLLNQQSSLHKTEQEVFNDTVKKLKRRMTLQSNSIHSGGVKNNMSSFLQNTFDKKNESHIQDNSPNRESNMMKPVKQFYESMKKINTFTSKSRKSNASQGLYHQIMNSQQDSQRVDQRKFNQAINHRDDIDLRGSPLRTDEDMEGYDDQNNVNKNPFMKVYTQEEDAAMSHRVMNTNHKIFDDYNGRDHNLQSRRQPSEVIEDEEDKYNSQRKGGDSPDAHQNLVIKKQRSNQNSKQYNSNTGRNLNQNSKTSPQNGSNPNSNRGSFNAEAKNQQAKKNNYNSNKSGPNKNKKAYNKTGRGESLDFFTNNDSVKPQQVQTTKNANGVAGGVVNMLL